MNLILNVQLNKMNKNSYCVIMAGGLGKRFWPVSTKACPKQFCDILNVGKSFLRQTFERANQIFDTRNIFIVTGSAYEELTKQQIPEIPSENILKEPFGKNTAPCVAYAAYRIARINPHASMVVVPSDHFITNMGEMVNKGFEFSISGEVIKNKKWGLNLSGNVSFLKNKLISLSGAYNGEALTTTDWVVVSSAGGSGLTANTAVTYMAEGYPVGIFRLPVHDGFNQASDGKKRTHGHK